MSPFYLLGFAIILLIAASIYAVGGNKMANIFKTKTPADKLAEAQKLVEEHKKLEQEIQQQKEQVSVIETKPQKAAAPNPQEIKELEEQVHYYASNYRGIFNPAELPSVSQQPMQAEIACLLFGCLTELKKIRETLERLS